METKVCPYCGSASEFVGTKGDLYDCKTKVYFFGEKGFTVERSDMCYDLQIANFETRIAGMEAELADYGETVTKLRACLARQGADLVKYSGTINQLQAELAQCRERLEAWREAGSEMVDKSKKPDAAGWYELNVNPDEVAKLQDLGEV